MVHQIDVSNKNWIKWRKFKNEEGFLTGQETWKDDDRAFKKLIDGYNPITATDEFKKSEGEKRDIQQKLAKQNRKFGFLMDWVVSKHSKEEMDELRKQLEKL